MPLISDGLMALGGLGQGLAAGVDTYAKTRKAKLDEEKQKKDALTQNAVTSLLAAKQGYGFDPTTGGVALNTVGQAMQDRDLKTANLAGAKADDEAQGLLPDSDKSKRIVGLSRGLLGDKAGLLPEGLSATEIGTYGKVGDVMKETSAKELADESNQTHKDIAAANNATTIKAAGVRADATKGSLGLRDEQLAERMHEKVVSKIDGDPQLKAQLGQLTNMRNAMTLTEQAVKEGKPITAQQFQETQQAVLGSLGQKGQQSVAERNSKYLDSVGLHGKEAIQFLTGKPQDIGPDNPLYQHVADMARWESSNVAQQYKERLDSLSEGHGWIYDKHPDLKENLDKKIATIVGQAQGRQFGAPQTQQAPAAPQITEGTTATGPGGAKIVFKGGQWVPLK